MSIPFVFIREDGKGFIVRKGGVDFNIWQTTVPSLRLFSYGEKEGESFRGEGETILEAVDNALLKMKGRT